MSNKALSIELGAKAAENAALQKQIETKRAKVKELEERIKNSHAKIRTAFATVGLALPDNPTPEDFDNGLAALEGYNARMQQLADAQVMACGFAPESARERLGQSFADCFEPKK
jgi:hypothetical protein